MGSTQIAYITPVGKPRMTQADKWKKRPRVLRYREFCDQVRASKLELPEAGASVTFFLPMPKSWSKKKRLEMFGRPHQQKPDLDNLLKALCDAIYEEDCKIWSVSAQKLWSDFGKIIITEQEF